MSEIGFFIRLTTSLPGIWRKLMSRAVGKEIMGALAITSQAGAVPCATLKKDRAHGIISIEDGIVHSCNAFFGQLAANEVGAFDLWQTTRLFEIDVAKPNTSQTLNTA